MKIEIIKIQIDTEGCIFASPHPAADFAFCRSFAIATPCELGRWRAVRRKGDFVMDLHDNGSGREAS